MNITLTSAQRTLAVTGIVVCCGAGVYALGATQARSATGTAAQAAILTNASSPGTAASAASPAVAGVTVTGTGNATGTPDELQLSLDVATQASSAGAALDAANQDMSRVRDALRAHGVAGSDLQTSGMSVQASYGQQNTITGYQVTESLSAVLRDLGRAGDAITAASTAAGNAVRIDGVSLDLSDSGSGLLSTARASAMADAKVQAEQYATAAGRSLGQVVSISEVSNAQPAEPLPYASGAASARSAVPISPGTQQVSVSVTVTYALG